MNLLGTGVKHKKFGSGVVTNLSENVITVCFKEGEKRFQYPDAFPHYLILKNNTIQTKIDKLNDERLRIIEEKMSKEKAKSEYRNRIYTMKIPKKSQAVFNISPDKIQTIMTAGIVETGHYVSGKMKGSPRTPSALQPNSAVLLTGCSHNTSEDGRKILGAAMVSTEFWGKECDNGQIKLHKEYQLILPSEHALSFWNLFNDDTCPTSWGSVPFKYVQNQDMQRILLEICNVVSGTEQEQLATGFYRYFQSINRLPDLHATNV